MTSIDTVLEYHEPGLHIPSPGNAIPNLSYEYRKMTLADFAYQWTAGEMLKWMNYWWEIHQVNKEYMWFLK